MRFVAMIGHGPNWTPGRQVYEQGPAIQGHLEAMRRHYDDGRLLLGGPFMKGAGGIAVLETETEDESIALMEADPGVIAGVLDFEIRPLTAYFDAFSGYRAGGTVAQLRAARQAEGVAG